MLLDGEIAPELADATAASDMCVAAGTCSTTADSTPAAVVAALAHFGGAAAVGHSFSQFNLGVAHLFGIGAEKDVDVAVAYFEACELPEGYQYLHLIERGLAHSGRLNQERAAQWAEQARSLGFGSPWRKSARDVAGTGTLMHISIHSGWARHAKPGQLKPPTSW
jgi:TPR repeat protein